jgi:hypothetical protein
LLLKVRLKAWARVTRSCFETAQKARLLSTNVTRDLLHLLKFFIFNPRY